MYKRFKDTIRINESPLPVLYLVCQSITISFRVIGVKKDFQLRLRRSRRKRSGSLLRLRLLLSVALSFSMINYRCFVSMCPTHLFLSVHRTSLRLIVWAGDSCHPSTRPLICDKSHRERTRDTGKELQSVIPHRALIDTLKE